VGDRTVSGEILKASVAIRATLEAARQALEKELPAIKKARKEGRRIGVGVASGFKNVGAGKGKLDDAGAILVLLPGGRIQMRVSAVDMGQGIRTALLQVASEVLGVDEGLFEVISGDTGLTMRHGGAVGERQVLISGKAVELAAGAFKNTVLERAAGYTGMPRDLLKMEKGLITRISGEPVMTCGELAARAAESGETVEASYYYTAPKTYALADKEAKKNVPPEEYRNYPAYAYTTQVAVVEVDASSGRVKVLKIIAAHDCGRAINPQKIEGQIEGSCLMGLGYALSEAYVLKEGIPVTRTYRQLGVPTIEETPEISCLLIEDPEPGGPFGAKGVSEVATVPVTPAILNAIYDAAGVSLRSLPATPAKVLEELRKVKP
jgi:CO/xanthine dehydrogenase Mo-binding subunit